MTEQIEGRTIEATVERILSDPAVRASLQGERGPRGARGRRGPAGKSGRGGRQLQLVIEGDNISLAPVAEGGAGGRGGKGGDGGAGAKVTIQDLLDLGLDPDVIVDVCVNPLQQQCRPTP